MLLLLTGTGCREPSATFSVIPSWALVNTLFHCQRATTIWVRATTKTEEEEAWSTIPMTVSVYHLCSFCEKG